MSLEEIGINAAELRACRNSMLRTTRKRRRIREHAQVQNDSARIAIDEVLVTMAAAANRWPQPIIHGTLQRQCHIRRVIAQFDAARGIGLRCRKAGILPFYQSAVARVLPSYSFNRHDAPYRSRKVVLTNIQPMPLVFRLCDHARGKLFKRHIFCHLQSGHSRYEPVFYVEQSIRNLRPEEYFSLEIGVPLPKWALALMAVKFG
jgi:hypothetical protein